MTPPAAITIVIADDHRMIRSGLAMLLGSDDRLAVVGESGDVATTLREVRDKRPLVLVLDLNLAGESGLDAIPALLHGAPGMHIVVLTMQEDPGFARAALDAGATGFVLKDCADEELLTAVVKAARGERHLAPAVAAALAQGATPHTAVDPSLDRLTARERDVLALIGRGFTNPEIASSLQLSVRTVESHRAHIHQKIEAPTRADLVAYARRLG